MTEAAGAKVVTPYMRVSFNGKTYKVQVQPGPEGAAAFERQIRSLLQLPEGLEFDVIFHCRAPGTGARGRWRGRARAGLKGWPGGLGPPRAGPGFGRLCPAPAGSGRVAWSVPPDSARVTHPRAALRAPSPCHRRMPGDKLQLQGLNAFDAAVHCASLSNKQGAGQAGAADKRGVSKKQPGPFGRLLAALGCRSVSASDEAARAGAP
jgi:hypothetical protein